MTRFAYISFDQVPAAKGASTHIEAFVRGLAAEFGTVDLVTVGTGSAGVERWPGVRHWELPAGGVSLIDRVLSFGACLERWLAGRSYDVIQFRSIFEGLPILRECKGAALIFEVNGLPSIELKYRYPRCQDDRELMSKIRKQECLCVRAAACVVTPSGVTRDFLVKSRGATRVVVVPNGVDVELFRPAAYVSGGPLLYFGTLSSWQGVDLAIRAVARTGASLRILGTGNKGQIEGLERLAEKLGCGDRVVFGGPVAQLELARELAECSAVLAPLVWDDRNVVQGCCPLKVLEGMAAGRAVITSDLAVVRELGAVHGEQLWMVKPGSVDGLADAIVHLRDEPGLAERLGASGRRLVEQRFTWTQAVERLSAVYRAVLSGAYRSEPRGAAVPGRN